MAMIESLARISEIEARVGQLSGATRSATAPATAAAFQKTLSAADTKTETTGEGVTGNAIVEAAKKYLGVPYVFGGEDASGMDCSGLVQRVLADLGVDAPRVVSTQQFMGEEVGSLADAQPGDLIVTHNADHIVIYAGDGMIIHAPYEGRTVSYQKNYLTDADIQTIRRVSSPAKAETAAVSSTGSTALSASALNGLITSMGGTASAAPSVADVIAAAQMSMFSGSRA